PAGPPIGADNRRVFPLLVDGALGLRIARRDERYGRFFQLALPFTFGRQIGGPLVVLRGCEQVPVRGVGAMVQLVERDELHVTVAPDTVRLKHAWLAGDGLQPLGHGPFRGDEGRWILLRQARTVSTRRFGPEIACEYERSPEDGGTAVVIRQRVETQRFGQG